MNSHITSRLTVLEQETAQVRAELTMLHGRLASAATELDEARFRSFVSETPLADRNLHGAMESHDRVERRVIELEEELRRLESERSMLQDRLGGAAPVR